MRALFAWRKGPAATPSATFAAPIAASSTVFRNPPSTAGRSSARVRTTARFISSERPMNFAACVSGRRFPGLSATALTQS